MQDVRRAEEARRHSAVEIINKLLELIRKGLPLIRQAKTEVQNEHECRLRYTAPDGVDDLPLLPRRRIRFRKRKLLFGHTVLHKIFAKGGYDLSVKFAIFVNVFTEHLARFYNDICGMGKKRRCDKVV